MITNDLQALARQQIRKHGEDRYPTQVMQYMKLTAEVGELGDAMLKRDWDAIRMEMADVALSLAELANKFGLDLSVIVRDLVEKDARVFGSVSTEKEMT